MIVVPVGFMGAGKTTVGHILSERLGLPFVDSDVLIEQRLGRSVRDVWFPSDRVSGGVVSQRQADTGTDAAGGCGQRVFMIRIRRRHNTDGQTTTTAESRSRP
jgi:hypothetical protein